MSNLKKIVAVVDNDPEMRAAMARVCCRRSGTAPKPSNSAETFLTCASTSKAICLVVDIQLGAISGVELAHQLIADGVKYPIIFMTGLDDRMIKRQAAAVGSVAVQRKPFPGNMLIDAINRAIG